jgi:hypothetical protein
MHHDYLESIPRIKGGLTTTPKINIIVDTKKQKSHDHLNRYRKIMLQNATLSMIKNI